MIGGLISEALPYILGLLALLGGALGIYRAGGKAKEQDHNEERLEANEQTHNRIDAVAPVDPTDDVDIDERLSRLAGRANKR